MKTTFRDHVRGLAVETGLVAEIGVDSWINVAGIVRAAESLAVHLYIRNRFDYRLASTLHYLQTNGQFAEDA